MVVDKEVVERRLRRLEESLQKLRLASQNSLKAYLENDLIRDSAERNLQVAIQICIDIGGHFVASLGFRTPETYADIFVILREEGVLSDSLSGVMQRMVGLRNILVHDYLEINPELVYEHLDSLNGFAKFAREIIEAVDRYSS